MIGNELSLPLPPSAAMMQRHSPLVHSFGGVSFTSPVLLASADGSSIYLAV